MGFRWGDPIRGRMLPARPVPTRPISIGCGWSFPFKVSIKIKTYVGVRRAQLELGATR